MTVIRLARVARLVMATCGARRLFDRLGRVALVAVAIVFLGAFVAYPAERDTNPEFANYGDSFWWATVTINDGRLRRHRAGQTTTGQLIGVMVMVTGIAVLGLLAGSLASFLRLDTGSVTTRADRAPPDPTTGDALVRELDALRQQVARFTEAVTAMTRARGDPAGPDGTEVST